jgi:predicted CoA-substrate-specific enzyme activase
MRLLTGIDIGSGVTKAVILQDSRIIGKGSCKTGVDLEAAARQALDLALASAGLQRDSLGYIATTGFGRYALPERDIQITEITSAARGAHFLVPQTHTVLDVGNQSTRAIAVTGEGKVRTFKTNDKCAAGSGSFIVRAAKYLQVGIEDVGELALQAVNPQPISSVCAVLAESEIINHVSAGVTVDNILRGIYDSLAERTGTLLRRVGLDGELTLIGGVALQRGMVRALEERLKVTVHVPKDSQYVCALGAALLGLRRIEASAA